MFYWTFNLPNFNDRIPQGNGNRGVVGTYLSESLPNITGRIGSNNDGNAAIYRNAENNTDGKSLYVEKINIYGMNNVGSNTETLQYSILLDASRSSSIYQAGAPVQQSAVVVCFCIKY